jgi:hypothetical protein
VFTLAVSPAKNTKAQQQKVFKNHINLIVDYGQGVKNKLKESALCQCK